MSVTEGTATSAKPWTEWLMVFTALIAGLYFITFNILGTDLAFFPGDNGDARFNMYLLEHARQFFSGKVESFWDAPFMYPEDAVISYSDNLLGTAPIFMLFRGIGLDVITSFQYWYVMLVVLSFLAAFFFLRWALKNTNAAILGAWLFSFSLALQSQMTHAQTFPRFPIPIAIWFAMLYAKDLKPRYFLGLVLTVVYQFYCAVYLGFLLSIPLAIYLLVVSVSHRKKLIEKIQIRSWVIKMNGSLVAGILILLPMMLPYLRRSGQVEEYGYDRVIGLMPTFQSHVFSKGGSQLWDILSHHGTDLPAWWDHQLFTGGLSLISLLVFLGLILLRKTGGSKYRALALTALITMLLFLRVGEFSLYRLVFELPGFGSIRALGRIINIQLIFFAFALAWTYQKLENRLKLGKQLLAIVFLIFLTADNYLHEGGAYRTSKQASQQRVNDLTAKLGYFKSGSIISYEPSKIEDPVAWYQLDAMLASQRLGQKCLNGYSATSPVGFSFYWDNPNADTRRRWLEQKEALDMELHVIK